MQLKKINRFLLISLLFSSPSAFCSQSDKKKKSFSIKQVNEARIKKHAQKINRTINRKNLLSKAALIAGGSYALYSVAQWFTVNNQKQQDDSVTLEGHEIRLNMLEDLFNIQERKTGWEKTWSFCKNSGKNLMYWVGMPIFVGLIINKVQSYIASTQSAEAFDQHVTRCMEVLGQLVYTIQEIAEFINRTEKHIIIPKENLACICNRLITRMEQMIGFMRAKGSVFKYRLKNEAAQLEKRLTEYTHEFANDVRKTLTAAQTDYMQLAQAVARFGQRYGQEKQRFTLIEQEAQ